MATRFHYRPGDSEVSNFFHCVSRVVDRRFIFEVEEREFFIGQMRRYAALGGLRVVTFCVMSTC
jgi:putative transposase